MPSRISVPAGWQKAAETEMKTLLLAYPLKDNNKNKG